VTILIAGDDDVGNRRDTSTVPGGERFGGSLRPVPPNPPPLGAGIVTPAADASETNGNARVGRLLLRSRAVSEESCEDTAIGEDEI